METYKFTYIKLLEMIKFNCQPNDVTFEGVTYIWSDLEHCYVDDEKDEIIFLKTEVAKKLNERQMAHYKIFETKLLTNYAKQYIIKM